MTDSNSFGKIKHVILVLSGKGGVGKSTVATQLALGLVNNEFKVGILDLDLCGPSIPRMLELKSKVIHQCSEGWLPVYADEEKQLAVMSIDFLLEGEDKAVVWRGPKKNAMIKQFVNDVCWGELDYLVIDTPPGTSDEHIGIVEVLKDYKMDGAVLVTTPQNVATGDVRREITFCRKTNIPILGILENMSGFKCPHCSECTNIFSSGGGKALADQCKVSFLGTIPLDESVTKYSNRGTSQDKPASGANQTINNVVLKLIELTSSQTID
eukprot:gene8943-9897_t